MLLLTLIGFKGRWQLFGINNWDRATRSAPINRKNRRRGPRKLAKLSVLRDEWRVSQGRKREFLLSFTLRCSLTYMRVSSVPRIPSFAPAIFEKLKFLLSPKPRVFVDACFLCVLSRKTSLSYACLFITCSAWTFPAPAPWQPAQSKKHVSCLSPPNPCRCRPGEKWLI